MLSRATLILTALFWAVMNLLLWRAEYGARDSTTGVVPAGVVWRKMLTAPDSSSLNVLYQGKRVGFCHWTTSIGEELSKLKAEDAPPEGLLSRVSNFRVQLEGNVAFQDFRNRVRFDCQLRLTTNQVWQEFNLKVNWRPVVWDIRATSRDQRLRLKIEDGEARFEREFMFSELQNPGSLFAQYAEPFAVEAMSGFEWPVLLQNPAALRTALKWEACNDTLKVGPASTRAYRLQARLLDQFQIVIYISRVGEILRVELPNDLVLINDQLTNF